MTESMTDDFNTERLIQMISNGDIRQVHDFLEGKEIDLNGQSVDGMTPLMAAALTGRVRLIEELIEKGVDLNSQNNNGATALTLAVHKGYNRIVQILVEKGADLNIQNKKGATALILATQKGDMDMIDGLIGHGADLDIADCYGMTASMYAVHEGFPDVLAFLALAGADLEKKDSTGKTAFDWATVFSQLECLHLLDSLKKEHTEKKEERADETQTKEMPETAQKIGFSQIAGLPQKEREREE